MNEEVLHTTLQNYCFIDSRSQVTTTSNYIDMSNSNKNRIHIIKIIYVTCKYRSEMQRVLDLLQNYYDYYYCF